MNKYYTTWLGLTLFSGLFISCSKDVLKSYEDRIIGTWELYDVDKFGFGGNTGNLPFREGKFTFQEGGSLQYVTASGTNYRGSWDIDKDWVNDQCTTDNNGYRNCNPRQVKKLLITAVDFNNQVVATENFEEINFTSTNRMKANIYSGLHTYVFYFRRQ